MKVMLIDADADASVRARNADWMRVNVALKKIEKYHLDKGDEVIWNFPLMKHLVDKIYVSCIYTWNKPKCKEWEGIAEIGGTGYDVFKKLPPEIENMKPKINVGFTQRGCIRHCSFCVVHDKEGMARPTGDIYDFWDRKSKKIVILDNNILSLPKHFSMIVKQINKEKLKVDINSGFDCRLLTEENVKEIKSLNLAERRFAFDSLDVYPAVIKAVKLLKEVGIKECLWYVYCDEDFESALERLMVLKRLGQRPYLMRDLRVRGIKKYNILAGWTNSMRMIQRMDFYDYVQYYRDKGYFEEGEKELPGLKKKK